MDSKFLLNTSLDKIIKKYPFVEDYLKDNLIEIDLNKSVKDVIDNLQEDEIEEKGLSKDKFLDNLVVFVEQMIELLNLDESKIEKMVILPGINKLGEKENFDKLVISKGDIIAIVGPTGSGKSRLLADIEWGAQGDTPTKREILINGKVMSRRERFSAENKLVAQLSQNMNFVMDLTVFEFLELHAKSRMIENEKEIIDKIFTKANELAGEKFKLDTPVTSLSGGQSRALMIADTAILSRSPIVLIDEIENAGIDRKKALDLLVGEEKIVLMATHDPLLALMGNKRVIIQNGGIYKVMDITEDERKILKDLEKLDNIIQSTRNKLRYGQKLDLDLEKELQK
ncbi:ABC transporter ATP-binding protein [Fusobacterium hominis]|jgi:ABC-type lipoprotein export system ATPase subunit|uniref:ABC transporter ATP-binding protein n=2 Tax=Fusobacteriaceae TaxID=203492 RepID=A0A7G9GUH1_9FUSO|nr:ABC transporter ATP-binding protein [Fusobacterium hominis]